MSKGSGGVSLNNQLGGMLVLRVCKLRRISAGLSLDCFNNSRNSGRSMT